MHTSDSRSLLLCNRSLLTLTHTSDAHCLDPQCMSRSLLPCNRPLLTLTHTSDADCLDPDARKGHHAQVSVSVALLL